MYCFLLVPVLIVALSQIASCTNILFVTLLPSPSHHIWNEAIAEGLVKNGHNVTLLGHDSPRFKSENYTVLKIEGVYESFQDVDLAAMVHVNDLAMIKIMIDFNIFFCNLDIKSPILQTLLAYPQNMFDVILYDLNSGHCLYPLIQKFGNPPVIGISAFGIPALIGDMMGHHIFPYVPYHSLPYSDKMTFLQKLYSLLLHNTDVLMRRYMYVPSIFAISQSVFGQNITNFEKVERNITLLLANIEPVWDYPQPLPPNVISVGGLHVKAPKSLPEDLQKILDSSTNGVIYFSLGTNIKPEQMEHKQRQFLMNAFGKLPYTILSKFGGTNLAVPKNVVLRKWLPQNDILGHKNVKLFFTHGGALSTHEALYHGVPVVGMPVYIDQHSNVAKIVDKKLGKKLNFFSFTEKEVYETLTEVINNPLYRNNMQALSKKFHDQPQTPLKRAIFWVEYVIRNGNADHLSIAARDMSFYETLHLDTFAFLIFGAFLVSYVTCKLIKLVLNLLTNKKSKKRIKQQ